MAGNQSSLALLETIQLRNASTVEILPLSDFLSNIRIELPHIRKKELIQ
jgi:hypothetical protein